MSGNTFGKIFKITTFGESHGTAMGCILDGCPPQIELTKEDIQHELDRRKPGQSDVTTQRKENDAVEILSGVFEGKTTGTPISMIIYNKDMRSRDYETIKIKNLRIIQTSKMFLDQIMPILLIKQNMDIEITEAAEERVLEKL